MIKNKITPYCVFDEKKHPMKSDTHSDRSEKRFKSKNVLASFCDRGKINSNKLTADDCNEAMKCIKTLTFLTSAY